MLTPLEITFQGVEKSDAVEAMIAEKAAKLEKHFERITHFRVVVSSPNRHSHKGKIYQIKLDIGIPDRASIVLTHEPDVTKPHEDLVGAIREAFDAAKRRLDETAEKIRSTARAERSRRRPANARLQ